MVKRTSPFRAPFPRRFLLRIHEDLFSVDNNSSTYQDKYSELSVVEKIIIISEDRRFLLHNGISYRSIIRDIFKILTFQKHGGASTIDMQFVRTATGYYERTARRKLYEMLLARIIQYRYSKIEILRNYLDCAFFGSHIYGIQDASMKIFGKQAKALNVTEAAFIASMLVYPRPMQPGEKWERNISRRSAYLSRIYPLLKKKYEKLPSWESV